MANETIASFLINALLAVGMYFMQQENQTTKDRLKRLESKQDDLEKTTFKKEDFREFKEELWVRMDKMEIAFEKRFERIHKE